MPAMLFLFFLTNFGTCTEALAVVTFVGKGLRESPSGTALRAGVGAAAVCVFRRPLIPVMLFLLTYTLQSMQIF